MTAAQPMTCRWILDSKRGSKFVSSIYLKRLALFMFLLVSVDVFAMEDHIPTVKFQTNDTVRVKQYGDEKNPCIYQIESSGENGFGLKLLSGDSKCPTNLSDQLEENLQKVGSSCSRQDKFEDRNPGCSTGAKCAGATVCATACLVPTALWCAGPQVCCGNTCAMTESCGCMHHSEKCGVSGCSGCNERCGALCCADIAGNECSGCVCKGCDSHCAACGTECYSSGCNSCCAGTPTNDLLANLYP